MLLVVVLGAGCQGQSRREALEIICETPNDIDMSGSEPLAVLFYIGEEVRNDEILKWYSGVHDDKDVDYAAQLRYMAREAGIGSCPLADRLGD